MVAILICTLTLTEFLRHNEGFCTLGAGDFSRAVSGFRQVFIATRAKSGFLSRLRPTAEGVSAFGQHRKFPLHARKTSGTQGKAFAKSLTRWWNSVFLIDVEGKPEILKSFRQGRSHVFRNRLYQRNSSNKISI